MAESVTLACGELPRYFNFAAPTAANPTPQPVLFFTGATTGVSQAIPGEAIYKTFQASSHLIAGGAVTATDNIQGTNDPKTAGGARYSVSATNGSPNLTSGALFNGYFDAFRNTWIPPVMVGDTVWINGQTLTVSSIASASSITLSANVTTTGSLDCLIFGQLWSLTTAVTLTPAGTGFGVADATLVSAHRWLRASLSALTSASVIVQVLMGR
jgi:hypothetical protein